MKKISLIIALIPFLVKSQNSVELEFVKQSNAYRNSLGLSSIEYDSNLSSAAKYHLQYLIKGFEMGYEKEKFVSHDQILDLPGFEEILTPAERVEKLTNFKFAGEIMIPGYDTANKRIRFSPMIGKYIKEGRFTVEIDSNIKSDISYSFNKDKDTLRIKKKEDKKSYSLNYSIGPEGFAKYHLDLFKNSPAHHDRLIQNNKCKIRGKEVTLKMGVSSYNGIIVVVYGYPKSPVK
jgi:hypothetical protein